MKLDFLPFANPLYFHFSTVTYNNMAGTYRAETCSCISTLLLGEIQLCLTVCVIHKNSLLLNQHNGD